MYSSLEIIILQYINLPSLHRIYTAFPESLHRITLSNSLSIEDHSLQDHHNLIGKLLLLLSRSNTDCILREMVVEECSKHLQSNECIQYALQLLQATKYDFHPFNPLFRFLLQIAIQCDEFAYTLYWQLQVLFKQVFLSSPIQIIQSFRASCHFFILYQVISYQKFICSCTTGN